MPTQGLDRRPRARPGGRAILPAGLDALPKSCNPRTRSPPAGLAGHVVPSTRRLQPAATHAHPRRFLEVAELAARMTSVMSRVALWSTGSAARAQGRGDDRRRPAGWWPSPRRYQAPGLLSASIRWARRRYHCAVRHQPARPGSPADAAQVALDPLPLGEGDALFAARSASAVPRRREDLQA